MPGTMLREVQNVRQIGGDPSRRWFSDPGMDLIVWMEARDIVGFQLTYDKPHAEKAVTWRAGAPELSYTGVDDGGGGWESTRARRSWWQTASWRIPGISAGSSCAGVRQGRMSRSRCVSS